MENLDPPPPSPPNQGWENGAFLPFARLHPWFGGDGGLLFHFILSKIVEATIYLKLCSKSSIMLDRFVGYIWFPLTAYTCRQKQYPHKPEEQCRIASITNLQEINDK